MPIVMDSMTNDLDKAYAALPERLYVIQNGKVLYVGGMGPFDYKPQDLNVWIKNQAWNNKDSTWPKCKGILNKAKIAKIREIDVQFLKTPSGADSWIDY